MSLADAATAALRARLMAGAMGDDADYPEPSVRVGYGYDGGYGSWDQGAGFTDGAPGSPGFRVGFVTPVTIYDRMRSIDVAAHALDRDILRNVGPGNFQKAFAAWLDNWGSFFDKTLSLANRATVNVFRTDDLAAQVNAFALELDRFIETYSRQVTPDGRPVPPPSVPVAPPPLGKEPRAPEPSFWASIPWWGYGLAVAFLGAVGYSFYAAAVHAKKREEQLFEMVPRMIPGMGGMAYGRDAGPSAPVVVNVTAPTASTASTAPASAPAEPPA